VGGGSPGGGNKKVSLTLLKDLANKGNRDAIRKIVQLGLEPDSEARKAWEELFQDPESDLNQEGLEELFRKEETSVPIQRIVFTNRPSTIKIKGELEVVDESFEDGHAEIRLFENGYRFGLLNGEKAMVNGREIPFEAPLLKEGDVIRIGRVEFTFHQNNLVSGTLPSHEKIKGQGHTELPEAVNPFDAKAEENHSWTSHTRQIAKNSSELPKKIQKQVDRIIERSNKTGHEYGFISIQVGDKFIDYRGENIEDYVTSNDERQVGGEAYKKAVLYLINELRFVAPGLRTQPVKIFMFHTHPKRDLPAGSFIKTPIYQHTDGEFFTHINAPDCKAADQIFEIFSPLLEKYGYTGPKEILAGAVPAKTGVAGDNPYLATYHRTLETKTSEDKVQETSPPKPIPGEKPEGDKLLSVLPLVSLSFGDVTDMILENPLVVGGAMILGTALGLWGIKKLVTSLQKSWNTKKIKRLNEAQEETSSLAWTVPVDPNQEGTFENASELTLKYISLSGVDGHGHLRRALLKENCTIEGIPFYKSTWVEFDKKGKLTQKMKNMGPLAAIGIGLATLLHPNVAEAATMAGETENGLPSLLLGMALVAATLGAVVLRNGKRSPQTSNERSKETPPITEALTANERELSFRERVMDEINRTIEGLIIPPGQAHLHPRDPKTHERTMRLRSEGWLKFERFFSTHPKIHSLEDLIRQGFFEELKTSILEKALPKKLKSISDLQKEAAQKKIPSLDSQRVMDLKNRVKDILSRNQEWKRRTEGNFAFLDHYSPEQLLALEAILKLDLPAQGMGEPAHLLTRMKETRLLGDFLLKLSPESLKALSEMSSSRAKDGAGRSFAERVFYDYMEWKQPSGHQTWAQESGALFEKIKDATTGKERTRLDLVLEAYYWMKAAGVEGGRAVLDGVTSTFFDTHPVRDPSAPNQYKPQGWSESKSANQWRGNMDEAIRMGQLAKAYVWRTTHHQAPQKVDSYLGLIKYTGADGKRLEDALTPDALCQDGWGEEYKSTYDKTGVTAHFNPFDPSKDYEVQQRFKNQILKYGQAVKEGVLNGIVYRITAKSIDPEVVKYIAENIPNVKIIRYDSITDLQGETLLDKISFLKDPEMWKGPYRRAIDQHSPFSVRDGKLIIYHLSEHLKPVSEEGKAFRENLLLYPEALNVKESGYRDLLQRLRERSRKQIEWLGQIYDRLDPSSQLQLREEANQMTKVLDKDLSQPLTEEAQGKLIAEKVDRFFHGNVEKHLTREEEIPFHLTMEEETQGVVDPFNLEDIPGRFKIYLTPSEARGPFLSTALKNRLRLPAGTRIYKESLSTGEVENVFPLESGERKNGKGKTNNGNRNFVLGFNSNSIFENHSHVIEGVDVEGRTYYEIKKEILLEKGNFQTTYLGENPILELHETEKALTHDSGDRIRHGRLGVAGAMTPFKTPA
jgi:hypothetical protein